MAATISSPFKSEVAVQLPFKISPTGSIAMTNDYSKIWEYRVRQAVGTSLGERVFYTDYGINIPDLTFNTMSVAKELVVKEIESVFESYLPDLELDEVKVSLQYEEGILGVEVVYILPNNTVENVILGIATLSGDAPISEA